MLSFGQLRLSRPQLYTNMHAKKQRREVEGSCQIFYSDCVFCACVKQATRKSDAKPDYDLVWCAVLLIRLGMSCDLILSFTKSSGSIQTVALPTTSIIKTGHWKWLFNELIQRKNHRVLNSSQGCLPEYVPASILQQDFLTNQSHYCKSENILQSQDEWLI